MATAASLLISGAPAHAYHEGPTRAEVLGFDRAEGRIYFAQFDESEVGFAPKIGYFQMHESRAAQMVPGPLYLRDDPAGMTDRRIAELRATLEPPRSLNATQFKIQVWPSRMADSIHVADTLSRFRLIVKTRGMKREGQLLGVSYCNDSARIASTWGWGDDDPVVSIVSYSGILLKGCNEYEMPVFMTWPPTPKYEPFR